MHQKSDKCSTCKTNTRTQGQRFCKTCHATYERENRGKRSARMLDKAFLQGCAAMRADLMDVFIRIGRGELTGYTAHEIVKNTKADVSRRTSRVTTMGLPAS